jgi:hypothetical protein
MPSLFPLKESICIIRQQEGKTVKSKANNEQIQSTKADLPHRVSEKQQVNTHFLIKTNYVQMCRELARLNSWSPMQQTCVVHLGTEHFGSKDELTREI